MAIYKNRVASHEVDAIAGHLRAWALLHKSGVPMDPDMMQGLAARLVSVGDALREKEL